ncbi:MAG: carbohydrate-binding domain-containing protein [Bacteroidaceae bacterium]|nr:carbohydrate-binding domain-containing protein [Bacteroidaceae bacterium]
MKHLRILPLLVSLTTIIACSSEDDDIFNYYNDYYMSNGSATIAGELSTLDVSIDQSTAEPSTDVAEYFPDEEDAQENNEFTKEVNIDMSNPTAMTEDGVEVTVEDGHVKADHGTTKKVCYVVSGSTSNGSLTIVGEKKYAVMLNGVNITNPDSAALNLLSSKRAFITVAEGTRNTLRDGTSSMNDHKGALYCKGKLLFNGSGALAVYGNYNNGIHSADYIIFRTGNNIYVKSTANHGIKANDGVFINGGVLNVEVTAAAAKGINCESDIIVNGGRTTVITTGGGSYDTEEQEAKGSAGIKSDATLTVNGGELWLKSTGAGGKGLNIDTEGYFNGGKIYIVTTGGQYKSNNDTASPKGIKADGNISITGGRIWVRTEGTNGEGIETKAELSITGGETASYAYDDAINSKSTMTISGGYVFAQGRNNDGLDANGNCYIKGGTVYAICSEQPEVAIDANSEGGYKLYLTGGTVVAIGGLESGSSLTQACYQASSWSASTWYAMSVGGNIFSFQTPTSGGSGLVVSGASQPTLLSGAGISGGTTYFGGIAVSGATVSSGTTVSLSSYTGGNNMGNNMGPNQFHRP